jgi:phosphoglucosamine mutase
VKIARGYDWQSHAALHAEQSRVEQELGDAGRILIRASGTEPLLRVMVEARDEVSAERFARRLAETMAA